MKILVLGAGAIGGYYGGRLLEAGADVTFLVRPSRREILQRDGLRIRSQFGDFTAHPKTVIQSELKGDWDVVLLTSKAYDLESAIEAIKPAVGANTAVLPLLNGIAHIGRLNSEFGSDRVLGGLAKIVATVDSDGVIQHLNDWRYIKFGEQNGEMSERVLRLQAAFPKNSVIATALPNVLADMWEKIVHLSTVATVTTLMRASVGEIASVEGGTETLNKVLLISSEIAAREGFPMKKEFLEEFHALFQDKTSPYVPSILRDIEKHSAIEGDHIIGYMLDRARAHDLDSTIHQLAFINLQAYDVRRSKGRF
jgi:2-dehydropantoate 2-reductase